MAVTISSNGTSGPRGSGWLSGSGAPSNAVGFDGDFYANTANYPASIVVYGPKAAGVWPASGMTMSNGSTGAASGDLSGTYPAPTVAKVNGVTVSGTPATGRVIAATSSTAATWQDPASVAPSGSATGDLSGSYPGPTVAKVNGVAVTGAPSTGYVPRATGASAATWQALPTATTGAAGLIQIDGTATDITAVGTSPSAGGSSLAAAADHVHTTYSWLPSDNGLLWGSFPPMNAGGANVPSNVTVPGQLTLQRMLLRRGITVSKAWLGVSANDAGATLTSCYIGLYDSTGTLLTQTADISTTLKAAGVYSFTLTAVTSNVLPPGEYFVGMVLGAGSTWTTFNLKSSLGGITANAGLTAPHLAMASMLSGLSALPSSITLANMTTGLITGGWGSQWYGLS